MFSGDYKFDFSFIMLVFYSVNVLQSVYMVQHGLPYLNKSHGSIIAVSSAASQLGMPQVVPYSTSKHGLNGKYNLLVRS